MLSFVSGKSKVHVDAVDEPAIGFSTPSKKKPQPQGISDSELLSPPPVTTEKSSKSFSEEDLPDNLALLLTVTDGEGASPMREASVGQLFVEQTAKQDLSEAKHENDTITMTRPESGKKMTIDVDIMSDPVQEALPSVPIDPSPKKRQPTSASSDSPVNSTSSTPFAKVQPLVNTVITQETPSPRNPNPSVKLGKQRSKSMLAGNGNSFRGSFPTPDSKESKDGDSGKAAPSLFSLDHKLSPSEKFRSFMKSLAPSRSVSLDTGEASAAAGRGIDISGGGDNISSPKNISGGSVKASSGKNMSQEKDKMWNKDLKARIAKIQEEQWKFRQSQQNGSSSMKQGSFKTESVKEKDRVAMKLKMNKSGVAPIYNTYSIRAGLRKCEFRETLEAGAAVMKKAKSVDSDADASCPADSFDVDAQPLLTSSVDAFVSAGTAHPSSNPHHPIDYHPHSVTITGEGYMSEEDWKITNTEAKKKQLKAQQQKAQAVERGSSFRGSTRGSGGGSGGSSGRGGGSGGSSRGGDVPLASSYQNLEQAIEAALKEESAQNVNTSDCSDVNLVPLCYLQSSYLIEKRFGWESKDHTVKAEVAPPARHKSWQILRAAVQFSGAFNMIAAASAASPHPHDQQHHHGRYGSGDGAGNNGFSSPGKKAPAPEPAPNAPVIVLEATPVTDFVAGLVQQRHNLTSESCDSLASPPGSPDHSLSSPDRKKRSFCISKEVPRRCGSPERFNSLSPPPANTTEIQQAQQQASYQSPLQPVHRDDQKTAKLKATAKELHDHYNGLLWRDSSRKLIWQGTEDIILGTHQPRTNSILNTRSDMRWAGKTLNMFRPWSAARQDDAIDHFRHQRQASTRPGSPSSPSTLPTIRSGRNSPVFNFDGADGSPGRHGGGDSLEAGSVTSKSVTGRSVTTGTGTGVSATGGRRISSRSRNSTIATAGGGVAAGGGAAVGGGGSVCSGHGSIAVGDATVSKNGLVTYGLHRVDQSDVGSVLTANSNMYGSRSSYTNKRAPLLINLVKPLQATEL